MMGVSAGAHTLVFRLLLRLYPRRFRESYGGEMTRFFVERLGRAVEEGGGSAVARVWARTVVDVVKTALAERGSRLAPKDNRRKGKESMSSFLHDLRYAAGRLRKAPLFTVSAIVILAVGIGLNAAVFNVVDAVLFRPGPFQDPDRIVHIYQDSDDGSPSSTSFPAYREMAVLTDVFAGVAATSQDDAAFEDAEGSRDVSIEYATASYFPVLGVAPSRGRWFGRAHDQVGSEMVAVVSHHTWRTELGADPGIIGRAIRLNNQPVTIIGVGPRGFNGEAGALVTDFWLSISSTPVGGPYRVTNLDRNEDHWYQIKARLADGVTVEQAQTAMDGLARHLAEVYPELDEGRDITVFAHDQVRFHPADDGTLLTANVGVLVVAVLLLLLACGNLANLLLIRGISRGPEMAVRAALGAGRTRIVRLLLLEALLLSAAGGVAGLGIAALSIRFVSAVSLLSPGGALDLRFDHRIVVFGLLLTLATALLFGFLPALRSAKASPAGGLADAGRGRSAGAGVSVLRGGLVAAQVAISVVLIVGAGLLARSLANAERVDPGVDADRVAIVVTNLRQGGVTDGEADVVVTQLLERVEAFPEVERAAVTTRLPVQAGGSTTQIVDGYEPPSGTSSVELPYATVSRGYFETMGIPLVAGRTFSPSDHAEAPEAVVVNEAAARAFWGGNAVGGRIRSQGGDGEWREVIGVVGDVSVTDLRQPPTPMVYYSTEQWGVTSYFPVTLVARTRGRPAAITEALRGAVQDTRASLPITRLLTLDAHLGEALSGTRTVATLMGGFSLLALLLAGLGVYAAVAFAVGRRAHELGIRVAVGATSPRLITMVVRESLLVVGLGLAAGLVMAVPTMRGLEGMLFGVGVLDGTTFGSSAALLLAAAAFAAFLPARRAAKLDPVEVLRSQ